MNSRIEEALGILQEECAEVIVEISKIRRFGLTTVHYKTNLGHREMLVQELGDVLALVDILLEENVVEQVELLNAKVKKQDKLKKFSNLYYETQSK